MTGESIIIGDEFCKFHSNYKGWKLYRAWNLIEGHGKMKYFAISPRNDLVRAKNLSGIKDAVSEADGYI